VAVPVQEEVIDEPRDLNRDTVLAAQSSELVDPKSAEGILAAKGLRAASLTGAFGKTAHHTGAQDPQAV
jgi:hypothetical protein